MKKTAVGILTALLLAGVLCAAPPSVKIPPEVKPSGQYVTLTPEGDATAVLYVGLSGVDPIPSGVLKDARMFLLDTRGLAAGRYKFAAVASGKDGEQARFDFVVVVGDAPPVPPGPGPGPGPGPVDALTAEFQAAYDKDAAPDKADSKDRMIAFYKGAVKSAESEKPVTWEGFHKEVGALADEMKVRGKLPGVQKVAQDLLKDRLVYDAESARKQMTTDDKKLAADTFKRLASALEGVR